MARELPKIYDPSEVESSIYKMWEDNGYFHAERDESKKPFTIVMPPPNVTGQLHMGHAVDNTMQDILIRAKRMQGYSALWLPGTDHASIATEAKVVEAMAKEGLTKDMLGREGFLERAWEWKNTYGNRIVQQLKKLGMLIVQDQVWNRVTINRAMKKTTWYYIDEFHLLLREPQTAAYSIEIWKRFRKWGGIPTGITQNVKDLLASREVESIFENSEFVMMLNQAAGDRAELAKRLNISKHQLSHVTQSGEGEGLLYFGNVIIPFVDRFPKNTELYSIMTTKPSEMKQEGDRKT